MSADDEEPPSGYRSPPVAKRFKPGQSGNPKGRPRRLKASPPSLEGLSEVDTLALKIANQQVTVREGERTTTLTLKEAALRSEAAQAAKGKRLDRRDMLERLDRIHAQQQAEKIKDYEDWSLIKTFHRLELERGVHRLPHPDDIVLGPGPSVEIVGPLNAKELATLQGWLRIRDLLGLQAVFDLQHVQKHVPLAQRADLLPFSILLMFWIDACVPKRFQLGAAGIRAATDAHLWRSHGELADAIKAERRELGLDPGGRIGPMKFATPAQAEKIFRIASHRNT
jgi:hypothetical protein